MSPTALKCAYNMKVFKADVELLWYSCPFFEILWFILTQSGYLALKINSSTQKQSKYVLESNIFSNIQVKARNGSFWHFLAIFRVENIQCITLLYLDHQKGVLH